MRNYWVISDTHFFHANSIKWEGRNHFNSIEEADALIEDNWKKSVKPGDYVYHLGDVFMGPSTHEQRHKLISRLPGSKRLIVGNHDDIRDLAKGGWFAKVNMWKVFNEFKVLMTHVPIHQSSIQERLLVEGGVNLHGHTHFNGSPDGPYISACVELNNFSPVNLEDIRDRIK